MSEAGTLPIPNNYDAVQALNLAEVNTDQERLLEEFRFDLKGHELIDPPKSLSASVFSEVKQLPISMAGEALPEGVDVYDINIIDPFTTYDPEAYLIVDSYVSKAEEAMRRRGYDPRAGRHEATKPRKYNDFTKAWVDDEKVKGVKYWRQHVPTAIALSYLQEPMIGNPIYSTKEEVNETVPISPESAAQMRFVADAIGIRGRRSAIKHLNSRFIRQRNYAQISERLKAISLASGTSESTLAAIARDRSGYYADLALVDIDENAMAYVSENAIKHSFMGKLYPMVADIMDEGLKDKLAKYMDYEDQLYDLVDTVGIAEYFPNEGDELGARLGLRLPQASELAKQAYSFLKPGGMWISGNMILDRPQFDFVFGIVDWPLINARSDESILKIYKDAGILDDPEAKISMYRVKTRIRLPDGKNDTVHIYTLVKVERLPFVGDAQLAQAA
jgi:SAM-dependent methyltransferase